MNWVKAYNASGIGIYVNLADVTRLTSVQLSPSTDWTIEASASSGQVRLDFTFASMADANAALANLVVMS